MKTVTVEGWVPANESAEETLLVGLGERGMERIRRDLEACVFLTQEDARHDDVTGKLKNVKITCTIKISK
jgi:hypothetical protein